MKTLQNESASPVRKRANAAPVRAAKDPCSRIRHSRRFPQATVACLLSCCLLVADAMAQDPSNVVAASMPWIGVSDDGSHFVAGTDPAPFRLWGVNYDHDTEGTLLEDYWHQHWPTVVEDFREIRDLNANVVRIHLQLPQFMDTAHEPNRQNLDRLRQLVELAEETGLYLDITGLGCYHEQDVPDWYDQLDESARWEVQARFWREVAEVSKASPAVFCYDLMNEPILAGDEPEEEWLTGELGGKYFVQRITLDLRGRSRKEVAAAWVKKLTDAIREVDSRHMITVGVIPWAHTFKGAKPLFYSPEVGEPLDFVSVHFYPKGDAIDESLEALRVYDIGKPLVVEEIFPLKAGLEQTAEFIERAKPLVDGWISFYWGTTAEEYESQQGLQAAVMSQWLRWFRENVPVAD